MHIDLGLDAEARPHAVVGEVPDQLLQALLRRLVL